MILGRDGSTDASGGGDPWYSEVGRDAVKAVVLGVLTDPAVIRQMVATVSGASEPASSSMSISATSQGE